MWGIYTQKRITEYDLVDLTLTWTQQGGWWRQSHSNHVMPRVSWGIGRLSLPLELWISQSLLIGCTGNLYKADSRLRECCRQVEAEEVSNSRNKIPQTCERSYRDSLWWRFTRREDSLGFLLSYSAPQFFSKIWYISGQVQVIRSPDVIVFKTLDYDIPKWSQVVAAARAAAAAGRLWDAKAAMLRRTRWKKVPLYWTRCQERSRRRDRAPLRYDHISRNVACKDNSEPYTRPYLVLWTGW